MSYRPRHVHTVVRVVSPVFRRYLLKKRPRRGFRRGVFACVSVTQQFIELVSGLVYFVRVHVGLHPRERYS